MPGQLVQHQIHLLISTVANHGMLSGMGCSVQACRCTVCLVCREAKIVRGVLSRTQHCATDHLTRAVRKSSLYVAQCFLHFCGAMLSSKSHRLPGSGYKPHSCSSSPRLPPNLIPQCSLWVLLRSSMQPKAASKTARLQTAQAMMWIAVLRSMHTK